MMAQPKAAKEDLRPKAAQFVSALTELSRTHGIGIAGKPVLFLMESDDFDRYYKFDDESGLSFD